MIQQKIYFTDATYNRMYEDGYLGNANIIFEKALRGGEIFDIGKESHFYIVDEDLKQRIDKAIEYIESECNEFYVNEPHYRGYQIINIEPLLDILKGSDENEKEED